MSQFPAQNCFISRRRKTDGASGSAFNKKSCLFGDDVCFALWEGKHWRISLCGAGDLWGCLLVAKENDHASINALVFKFRRLPVPIGCDYSLNRTRGNGIASYGGAYG